MSKIKPLETASGVEKFLAEVSALPPVAADGRGRLILAMDATMSRQPTWDRALSIQSAMFDETAKIGGLDVQLVYFRGFDECRASRWTSDARGLGKLMTGIACQGGSTQILRVLKHVKSEAGRRKLNAVVYVGDAMEEGIDAVAAVAGEVGLLGIPVFMFQEGGDRTAELAFREIARLTRGAYFRFGADAAKLLRDLLTAVAVYAAGGRKALAARGGTSRLLLEQMT